MMNAPVLEVIASPTVLPSSDLRTTFLSPSDKAAVSAVFSMEPDIASEPEEESADPPPPLPPPPLHELQVIEVKNRTANKYLIRSPISYASLNVKTRPFI